MRNGRLFKPVEVRTLLAQLTHPIEDEEVAGDAEEDGQGVDDVTGEDHRDHQVRGLAHLWNGQGD